VQSLDNCADNAMRAACGDAVRIVPRASTRTRVVHEGRARAIVRWRTSDIVLVRHNGTLTGLCQ